MKTVISNSTKGSIDGILQEVKKRLECGEECTILTADRNVATMEKTILETLQKCGAEFMVEVMSFTRFCVQTLGNDVRKCLTPEGSVMLLADVIERVSKDFVYYRRVRPDSLANEVYAALTALRNSGLSTADFREKAEKLPTSLQNKAKDLALMHEGYLEALADKRHDSSTRLETLAEKLDEDCGDLKNRHFFVVDMQDFNHPQLKVLEALDKGVKSLTVGLVSGFDNKNSRIYPDNTIKKVKAVSKNKVAEVVCFEDMNPVQKSISKNLFSYEKLGAREIVDVKDGSFSLKVAQNRQDEVTFVALDIVKKIIGGARYKDFEILIGSEDYAPIIRNVFDRYGIVYFIDKKEMLQRQTKAKYLLSALSVLTKNYRSDEVLDFVKNPLFELSLVGEDDVDSKDMVFRFENYVLEYGVNFGKFLQPFEYGDDEKRIQAEEVRKALCKTLHTLGENKSRPMEDIVASVREFLENAKTPWQKHVEDLATISEYYKKCAEQVDNKINAILGEIESVLVGDSDLDKFDTTLRSMFKTLKIALVPTYLDSVFIGDMSSKFAGGSYTDENGKVVNRNLYVIGANSGSLPPDTEGGAIITAKDEELFESAGIGVYPTQRQRIKQNLFTLTEILAKCKGQLTISYSLASTSGELNPSSIISQFKTMFKKNGEPMTPEFISFDNLRASMTTPFDVSVMFKTDKSVKHSILTSAVSGRATESDMDIYRNAYKFMADGDKVIVGKIYDVPEQLENAQNIQKTSISRLERYFKCPYSYYLNYTLGLKRREEGEITGLDNGTILHAVFENFFKDLKDGTVTRENVAERASDTFDNLVSSDEKLTRLMQKPDTARLLGKLKKEGIRTCRDFYEWSLCSKFAPTYLEAEFSKDGSFKPIAIDIDGRTVELRGKIDRVDIFEDRFIVIDYKTYKSVTLAPHELYHGEKLQLYIYAMSIMQNIDKKVAGVFYLPVFPGFVREGKARYELVGQITDNELVRNAIFEYPTPEIEWEEIDEENELDEDMQLDEENDDIDEEEFEEEHIEVEPITYFPQADVLPDEKHALTDDEFLNRGNYALDLAKEGIMEIESGYIKPRPLGSICSTCDFASICNYRDMYPREKMVFESDIFEKYNKPDKTEFEEYLYMVEAGYVDITGLFALKSDEEGDK